MAAGDGARANTPRFYPDDPLARDPETEDASMVQAWDVSGSFDFFENSFGTAGDRTPRRAMNLNTLDEVPDSSWFTNRLVMRPLTLEELVRGPDTGEGPAPGKLTVISGKNEGISPGMTLRDSLGEIYFVKFDPPTNPEMATGAEVISTKIFHAFGYHVPENYITTLRPSDLVIEPGAQVTRADGHVHNVQQRDLDELFRRVAQKSDGSYRMVASRAVAGKPLGPFRYHGTRSDDPNDIFPHEHRRELRGIRVLAAWVNHDEWRSSNSFDALVDTGGRRLVKHHLLDFGSTLGSGSIAAQSRRPGNEYVWERRPTLLTMLTLGLYVRPWLKVKYPDLPAAGRIESDYFQPAMWKPDYPNPAYENARADDLFWAARRVAAFSDDAIRALVGVGEFTDPAVTDYLTDVLIERRDKVCRLWLNQLNPLVDFSLAANGSLSFRNAAVDAGVATPALSYWYAWSSFDNATGITRPVGDETQSTTPGILVPPLLHDSEFAALRISSMHPDHPEWMAPITVYFRRDASEWKTVGLERELFEEPVERTN